MVNLYQRGLAEIKSLLKAPRHLDISELPLKSEASKRGKATQPASREVIEPTVCTLAGDIYLCRQVLSEAGLSVLHNEQPDAANYPLSFASGLFFSEAMSPKYDEVNEYHRLVCDSISVIKAALDKHGRIAFDSIDEIGQRIQKLDAEFARRKINEPQDELHRRYGPNAEHPYSKIALCRTTVPVIVEDRVIPFFFEKFLVAYSYFDRFGNRKSTVTPPHSHPLNFETVYFTSYGPKSIAIEQEFDIVFGNDQPLIMANGRIHPEFTARASAGQFGGITLVPGKIHYIYPMDEPLMLTPLESDAVLKHASLINFTDGLFRPHRVTICDDSDASQETLYYALDNYLGPRGRVLLFSADGRVDLWSHRNWR